MVWNGAWGSTCCENVVCKVIWCSGTRFTNRGRSRVSYTLGIKTMNNGWGKTTNGTQRCRGSADKNDRLTTKRAACGSVRDQLVEAGLAKLVRDVVWCMEGDKCVGILEANEALLPAEMELNGGLEGGMLVPHRGSEEAFTFWDLPLLRIEICTFKHNDTLLGGDT